MGCEKARQSEPGRSTGSVCRSPENDVLFRPGMNATAVRTGELLRFQGGPAPASFFNCPPGIGEL
jgi:hypothetical protein